MMIRISERPSSRRPDLISPVQDRRSVGDKARDSLHRFFCSSSSTIVRLAQTAECAVTPLATRKGHTANINRRVERKRNEIGPVSRRLVHEDASVREIKTKNSPPPCPRATPLPPRSSERASYSAATGLPAVSSMDALLPTEALPLRGRCASICRVYVCGFR